MRDDWMSDAAYRRKVKATTLYTNERNRPVWKGGRMKEFTFTVGHSDLCGWVLCRLKGSDGTTYFGHNTDPLEALQRAIGRMITEHEENVDQVLAVRSKGQFNPNDNNTLTLVDQTPLDSHP